MAGTGVTIRIVSNRLPAVAAGLGAAVAEAVRKTTLDIEAEAKRLVPVRTGTLRRSIHSTFENGGRTGRVGPSVDYGVYVEFGSRGRAARPYMRPAAERSARSLADNVRGAIRDIL